VIVKDVTSFQMCCHLHSDLLLITIPVSEYCLFSGINIYKVLQQHMACSRLFTDDYFTTHLLQSLPMKEFRKLYFIGWMSQLQVKMWDLPLLSDTV